MGDGDVHVVLLHLRDSHRRAGRSHRSPPRADADRAVVVGVHVVDRRRLELLPAPLHQILLWRRRSRRIPQRIHRRLALVPGIAAREHVRGAADGEPDWRRHRAAPGGPHPDSLRLARGVLRVRRHGRDLGGGMVRLVSRQPGREIRHDRGGARGDRHERTRTRPRFSLANGVPFRDRPGDALRRPSATSTSIRSSRRGFTRS